MFIPDPSRLLRPHGPPPRSGYTKRDPFSRRLLDLGMFPLFFLMPLMGAMSFSWVGGILGFFGFMGLMATRRLYQGLSQAVLYPVLLYFFSGASESGAKLPEALIPSGLVFMFFAWLTYAEWKRGPDQ